MVTPSADGAQALLSLLNTLPPKITSSYITHYVLYDFHRSLIFLYKTILNYYTIYLLWVHYRNPRLCRVSFVGHSAKKALPRAALGKVRLSATRLFTECWTLGTGPHSAKTCLPSVNHSAKGRQRPSQSWRPPVFAESRVLALSKESSLPSAK
jgi:hypothetical protein